MQSVREGSGGECESEVSPCLDFESLPHSEWAR